MAGKKVIDGAKPKPIHHTEPVMFKCPAELLSTIDSYATAMKKSRASVVREIVAEFFSSDPNNGLLLGGNDAL